MESGRKRKRWREGGRERDRASDAAAQGWEENEGKGKTKREWKGSDLPLWRGSDLGEQSLSTETGTDSSGTDRSGMGMRYFTYRIVSATQDCRDCQ